MAAQLLADQDEDSLQDLTEHQAGMKYRLRAAKGFGVQNSEVVDEFAGNALSVSGGEQWRDNEQHLRQRIYVEKAMSTEIALQ